MWNPKYFLLTVSILVLEAASAQATGEILRNTDGSIKYMTHYDASKACLQGTRLPTARELANESQARGAKGILELSQVKPDSVPNGYYKISSFNSKDEKDEFYFNHDGYRRPAGDLGNNWFWSSSYSSVVFGGAYLFDGGFGYVDFMNIENPNVAVRCLSGR